MLSAPTAQRLILGGSLVLLLAGNCTKPMPPVADDTTSLLTSHAWRIVAYTTTDHTASPAVTVNTYATLPAYRRDDTYGFLPDNSLLFTDGPLRQQPTDPATTSGTWQLPNSTSLFIALSRNVPLVNLPAYTASFTLRSLSADTLRLSGGPPAQTVDIRLTQ